MSPSHLAALFGVLGSELQLDRRRVFLRGELGSSADTSRSGWSQRIKKLQTTANKSSNGVDEGTAQNPAVVFHFDSIRTLDSTFRV